MKNKGKAKVHPFASSSSSSSSTSIYKDKDSLSVLNLLPAAILALLSVLSNDDRHVLAYMLTRSLHSDDTTNKSLKKPQCSLPNFDCDCFRCYTAFWLRWDSSPNRDLIHRAIEAFEDHLNTNTNNGDDFKKSKGRKRDKMTRRKADKPSSRVGLLDFPAPNSPTNQERVVEAEAAAVASEADEKGADMEEHTAAEDVGGAAAAAAAAPCSHKALARKVLPDVMGIFNSRLWSLWSPNV